MKGFPNAVDPAAAAEVAAAVGCGGDLRSLCPAVSVIPRACHWCHLGRKKLVLSTHLDQQVMGFSRAMQLVDLLYN